MNLSKIILPVGILGSSFLTPCFADDAKGFYVKPNIGISSISDVTATFGASISVEIDDGTNYGINFGYDFGNDVRTEIGYDVITTEFSRVGGVGMTGDIEASTFSASVFKDFSSDSKFTPYIGAGLGSTNFDVGTINIQGNVFPGAETSSTSLALTLGTNYKLNEGSSLFIEGTYRKFGDITVSGVEYSDLSSLGLGAGIKISF